MVPGLHTGAPHGESREREEETKHDLAQRHRDAELVLVHTGPAQSMGCARLSGVLLAAASGSQHTPATVATHETG